MTVFEPRTTISPPPVEEDSPVGPRQLAVQTQRSEEHDGDDREHEHGPGRLRELHGREQRRDAEGERDGDEGGPDDRTERDSRDTLVGAHGAHTQVLGVEADEHDAHDEGAETEATRGTYRGFDQLLREVDNERDAGEDESNGQEEVHGAAFLVDRAGWKPWYPAPLSVVEKRVGQRAAAVVPTL